MSLADEILELEKRFSQSLEQLEFGPPVYIVYNPCQYAACPHEKYVQKYCTEGRQRDVVFLGMNPGPFGMVQTGVPFGEVETVRDWLGVEEKVAKPPSEHPKRPILGFACSRSEVSGVRFWGLVRKVSDGDPARFFRRCFVHNYCPLAFLDEKGKNITPPTLKKRERMALENVCDIYLLDFLKILRPKVAVGIGNYAMERLKVALKRCSGEEEGLDFLVDKIPHPSPINPAANKAPGWEVIAMEHLSKIGVLSWMNSDV